jgi:hypothetical protein
MYVLRSLGSHLFSLLGLYFLSPKEHAHILFQCLYTAKKAIAIFRRWDRMTQDQTAGLTENVFNVLV